MTALESWPWLQEHFRRTSGCALTGEARPAYDLRELYKTSDGLCFHCMKLTELTLERKDLQATRDHLIPRSKGGGEGANIVLSCYRCNQDKGNTMPGELESADPADTAAYSSAVEAAANAMRWKRRDLIAQPLAQIWTELAEAALEAAGKFEEAIMRAHSINTKAD